MVLDARLPEDVLFLIFEEDFRSWPQGEDPDGADDYKTRLDDILKKRKRSRSRSPIKMEKKPERTEAEALPQTGAASSSASGAYRPEAKGKRRGNIVTEHHDTPIRGSTDVDDVNDGLSSNVADLLRMATLCHRENMGDLILVLLVLA